MVQLDLTNKLFAQLLAGEITREEYEAALKKEIDQILNADIDTSAQVDDK